MSVSDTPMGGLPWDFGSRAARAVFVAAVAVALMVVAIVVGAHFASGGGGGGTSAPQLATAAVRTFPVTVTAAGTVVPAAQTSLNFSSAGTITEIDTSVRANVAKGAVLARLSSTGAQSAVAQAQASLSAADAALAAAQSPSGVARTAGLRANLSAAESVLGQTESTVQTTNSQDAATLTADNQQIAADQARLVSDRCTAKTPPNASLCQTDQATLTSDTNRLQVDQARFQSDASTGQLKITDAQSQVTEAQGALQAASASNPTQVASAQAAVASATAQLNSAQAQLATTTLVAPADGTVLEINGQVGENVSGGPTTSATLPGTNAPVPSLIGTSSTSTSASSEPLIVLGTLNSYVVGVAFTPEDAQKVTAGRTCTITANTLAGLSQPCHVLAIAPTSTLVNGNYVVYATMAIDGSSKSVAPGMSVNIDVNVGQANNVLAAPQSAVYLLGGVPHVDVWDGHRAIPTVVTVGLQGNDLAQISSGVVAGDQLVLSANQGLPSTATTVAQAP